MPRNDETTATSTDTGDVVILDANAMPDQTRADEPGWEEGPHLQNPNVRTEKLAQLLAAGIDADDERLTDDMRDILLEYEAGGRE